MTGARFVFTTTVSRRGRPRGVRGRTRSRQPPSLGFDSSRLAVSLLGIAAAPNALLSSATMDPHERATSVWYRIASLLRRKDLAIEIIAAEICSAQQEALRDAANRVSDLAAKKVLHELARSAVPPPK